MFFILLFDVFSIGRINKFVLNKDIISDYKWFDQYIDRENETLVTFKQRYSVEDYGISNPKSVILYISGESDSFSVAGKNNDFVQVLAGDLEAHVISIEHRFYGESKPFNEYTTENYKYLDVKHAIDDLYYFATQYRETINNKTKEIPWLVIGGSYSGLLSAYARLLHPEVFTAALSSSGVVQASNNFTDYDRQIAVAVGQECSAITRRALMQAKQMIANGDYQLLLSMMGAEGLEEENFYYVFGEIVSVGPQYGKNRLVCDALEASLTLGKTELMAFADFTKNVFSPVYCDGNISSAYSNAALKNETAPNGARSWLYQTCSELSYWQTSPGAIGLRSEEVNQEFFRKQCKDVFGIEDIPNVDLFNEKYGGLNFSGTKVFFTTGSQDPWTHLCITEDIVPEGCYAKTMIGDNVGHCRDLYAQNTNDPIDVIRTRSLIRSVMKGWMFG